MKRVYENDKWMVGLKNWKPANDLGKFDGIERHRETDELFVLVEDPRTGSSNSDTRRLAPGELAAAKEVVAKAP